MSVQQSAEGQFGLTVLLRAGIGHGLVFYAHTYLTLQDLQFTIGQCHAELFADVISGSVFNHRRTIDSIRCFHHIDTGRTTRRQAADRVGISFHHEFQRLKACRTVDRTVIRDAHIADSNDFDRIFLILTPVCDGQCAGGLFRQVIVHRNIIPLHILDHQVIGKGAAIRGLGCQCPGSRGIGNRPGMSVHQRLKTVIRLTGLFRTVVHHSLIFRAYSDLKFPDLKSAAQGRAFISTARGAGNRDRITSGSQRFSIITEAGSLLARGRCISERITGGAEHIAEFDRFNCVITGELHHERRFLLHPIIGQIIKIQDPRTHPVCAVSLVDLRPTIEAVR